MKYTRFAPLAALLFAHVAVAQTPPLFSVDSAGGGTIYEINPFTGGSVSLFATPIVTHSPSGGPGPEGLAYNGTHLYFVSGNASEAGTGLPAARNRTIYELDRTTGATLRTLELPAPSGASSNLDHAVDALAASHNTLWAHRPFDQTILVIDIGSFAVTGSFALSGISDRGGMGYNPYDGYLYISEAAPSKNVHRLNATTGAVISTITLPSSGILGVDFVHNKLFVNQAPDIVELSPATGMEINRFPAPGTLLSALAGGPAPSWTCDTNVLYSVNSERSSISVINPNTGAHLHEFLAPVAAYPPGVPPSFGGPEALSHDGTKLNYLSGDHPTKADVVYKVDECTGAILDAEVPPWPAVGTGVDPTIDALANGTYGGVPMLFALRPATNEIYRFDRNTGLLAGTTSLAVNGIGGLGFSNARQTLFMSDFNASPNILYEINPASGAVIASHTMAASDVLGVDFVGERLFVSYNKIPGEIQELTYSGAPAASAFAAPDNQPSALAGRPSTPPTPPTGSVGMAPLFSVDSDTDLIYELDPFTGAVRRSFPTPVPSHKPAGAGPDGLAFDGTTLYYTSGNASEVPSAGYTGLTNRTIFYVDPASGSVVNTFALPAASAAGDMSQAIDALASDGVHLYANRPADGVIYKLDPATKTILATITLSGIQKVGGMGFNVYDGHLYISDANTDTVHKIDPATGNSISTFSYSPRSGILGIDFVWNKMFVSFHGSPTEILEVSPTTGQLINTLTAPGNFTASLAGPPGSPWICNTDALFAVDSFDSTVSIHDPNSGAVLHKFLAPIATAPPSPTGNLGGPEGLAFSGNELFYVSGDHPTQANLIYRMDPCSGATTGNLPVAWPTTAADPSIDALGYGEWGGTATLFASRPATSEIFAINPSTGAITSTITVAGSIIGGLGFHEGRQTLYASDWNATPNVVHEINPTSGVIVATETASGQDVLGVDVLGTRLYTATDNGTGLIEELDPAFPASPSVLRSFASSDRMPSALAAKPASASGAGGGGGGGGGGNQNPIAVDDAAAGNEDTVINVDVLANDSDPDGGSPHLAGILTPPINGKLDPGTGDTIDYTPNRDFHGTDTFVYQIGDGQGGTAAATATITVHPINDDPEAHEDHAHTPEETLVTIDLLANDQDVDGDALTITALGTPANGTVVDNSDGTVDYTPATNFAGTDTFTYTIVDGNGGTDQESVFVQVGPVNDPPDAVDDTAQVDEDSSVEIPFQDNDTDPEDDPRTIVDVTDPAHGTVSDPGNGNVVYTPNPNFNGVDSFTYTISDGNGGSDTATVTVTVVPVNDAPVTAPDAATTQEDTPVTVNVLANDTDPDGDTLLLLAVDEPANGSVTFTIDGNIVYTPDAGFVGSESFSYTASDGTANVPGTVTITVEDVNKAPVAADDAATVEEDGVLTFNVLTNDNDPDGDAIAITAVTQPTSGTVSIGTGGNVTYVPPANFHGEARFSYTVEDPLGLSATANVVITVTPVGDAPVANPDVRRAFEVTSVRYDVLANDSDADGDRLRIVAVGTPLSGTAEAKGDAILYTPAPGFSGTDQFSYTIADPSGATSSTTVTVSVVALPADDDGVDESTEAGAPNNGDGNGDGIPDSEQAHVASLPSAATGQYVSVESEPGSELASVTSSTASPAPPSDPPPAGVSFPAGFLDFRVQGGTGNTRSTVTLHVGVNHQFTSYVKYGPTPDNTTPHWYEFIYDGTTGAQILSDRIILHFIDGQRGDDDLTVNGEITDPGAPVVTENKLPQASADAASIDEDTGATIDVLANDVDGDGDVLTIAQVTQPENGTVTVVSGQVVYTPDENFFGQDTFSYLVSDGRGGTTSATVTVTVNSVNDLPQAVEDFFVTEEDTPVHITSLLANDFDVENDQIRLSLVIAADKGQVARNVDGSVTYTPPAEFSGTDTFTYTITDGQDESIPGRVTITVTDVNDAPLAESDAGILEVGQTSITIDVLSNDSDVDSNTLTVVDAGGATHGTVTVLPDGSVLYEPGPTFTNADTFNYTVSDEQGTTSTGTVTIALGVAAPIAEDDESSVDEDHPIVISVLSNDSDPNGDALTVVSVTDPANGTAVIDADGNVVYTPDEDFFGTDTFTYEVSDGGITTSATVTVTVAPVNDAPRFAPAASVFTYPEDGSQVFVGGPAFENPVDGGETFFIDFGEATDVEGDNITYKWVLGTDEDVTEPVLEADTDETELSFLVSEIAEVLDGAGATTGAGVTVYHRIIASDGSLETASPVSSFTLVRGYITALEEEGLPLTFELHTAYPNPFNPVTRVRFGMPTAERVQIDVFDTVGRRVATLVEGMMAAGYHEVTFEAVGLPSGVYLYAMRAGHFLDTKTFVLVK